jgi:hypothetical protein
LQSDQCYQLYPPRETFSFLLLTEDGGTKLQNVTTNVPGQTLHLKNQLRASEPPGDFDFLFYKCVRHVFTPKLGAYLSQASSIDFP